MTDIKLDGGYKIAEIEPCTAYSFDTLIVDCETDTWQGLLNAIENELDNQYSERYWEDMEIRIKFRKIPKKEFEAIMENSNEN
jgi:hypothetical protein